VEIPTLGHVGGGNRCGGSLCRGLPRRTLTNLATQAKVEGIVPTAVWHWGSNSSVVNDPLVEPGRNPLNVSLPSVDGDRMFSTCPLARNFERSERKNKPLAMAMEHLSP
jgi:hypothetical protein